MPKMKSKNMSKPDEVREFDKAKIEIATLGGITFARATIQPGWKWSTSIKPVVKTKSCEAPHLSYMIAGRFAVRTDDGSKKVFGPGDIALIPPGHDAWVVGKKPVEVLDLAVAAEPAKPHRH